MKRGLFFGTIALAAIFSAGVSHADTSSMPPQPNPIAQEIPQKNILILSSYHRQHRQGEAQIAAFQTHLKRRGMDPRVQLIYLDALRRSTPEDRKQSTNAAMAEITRRRFDLIYGIGEDAYRLLVRYQNKIPEYTDLLFTDVYAYRPEDFPLRNNVTGMTNELPVKQMLRRTMRMLPRLEKFIFVTDDSTGGLAMDEQLRGNLAFFEGAKLEFLSETNWTDQNFFRKLAKENKDTTCLVFGSWNLGRGGVFSPDRLVISMLRENYFAGPILTLREGAVGSGALGGLRVDSDELGRKGASLAEKLLTGSNPAELPVKGAIAVPWYDASELDYFGIAPDIIPAEAELINRKASFFETHRVVLLLLTLLVLLILLLLAGYFMLSARSLAGELGSSDKHTRCINMILMLIVSSDQAEYAISMILEQIGKHLDAAGCSMYQYVPGKRGLECFSSYRMSEELPEETQFYPAGTVSTLLGELKAVRSVVFTGEHSPIRLLVPSGAVAALPMLRGNRLWGMLKLDFATTGRRLDSGEFDFLNSAAQLLILAVQRYDTMKALAGEELKLRSILENLPIRIAIVDTEGNYLFIHNSRLMPGGTYRHVKVHDNIRTIYAPDDAEKMMAAVTRTATTNQPGQFFWQLSGKDGVKLRQCMSLPLPDDVFGTKSLLLVSTDITELETTRRELAVSNKLLTEVLEQQSESILVKDLATGKYLFSNRNILRMLRLHRFASAVDIDDQVLFSGFRTRSGVDLVPQLREDDAHAAELAPSQTHSHYEAYNPDGILIRWQTRRILLKVPQRRLLLLVHSPQPDEDASTPPPNAA
ncbi:MAG: hypothetical protein PHS41_00985 [Victivallaceae bacterium]|nr:hypothetical protein [Victivallaceae bacterium]